MTYLLDRRRRLPATAVTFPPASLPLDTYVTTYPAHSFRKLRAAYAGSSCRIREDGGDTETDIGFDGDGLVDTAAIASHCGANNGFITRRYDQSATTSIDAVQTTASMQPKIYNGSSVITNSAGLPAMEMDEASQQHLRIALAPGATAMYFATAMQTADTSYVMMNSAQSTKYIGVAVDGDTSSPTESDATSVTYYANGTVISPVNRNQIHDDMAGDTSKIFGCKFTPTAWNTADIKYHSYTSSGFYYSGKASEYILYKQTDIDDTDFAAVMAEMLAYWG